ncbi:MAG: glycine zipper 2TM domain-containing protein [Gammaproteobacteria bacterium]|nr:glycine zipper 2TM domain-containing protein [Gammaproteobacteria bacterium]
MSDVAGRNLFTTSVAIIVLVAGVAAAGVLTGVLPYKSKSSTNEPETSISAQEKFVPPPMPVQKSTPHKVHAPMAPLASALPPAPVCGNCGVIESIESFTEKGSASGGGAVAGGLLGGILGHQVGRGRGRDLATVAGAVGGAIAGNAVEKNSNKVTRYHVGVRMNDGTRQLLTLDTVSNIAMGGRVRIINGAPVSD